ncbi:hypothetical protein C2I33_04165 [Ralstonia solanacearum]|uniref:hypothetical protein n=1 Tax=Ralstonia solanacearum TaxID=305 RepID=UPI0002E9F89C|nr:hypothetical protein [Ralstonia solanacearum]MDC6179717.1 hypothetical protein [Ralstonia solanacearum]MDC6239595.1 hypothetical protein [Ralstonia solanacearum]TYZ56025.1 hypothetical protein C2I33_04165 [Ralstonia solanacearum]
MLTFSEEQWRALQACDGRQFMATVCDQFLANRPDLTAAPGRSAILERMTQAHDFAEQLGFTSTPHIVWLMYLVADAPALVTDPVIETYLRKAGATPEQRLDDMAAVMQQTLDGGL